MMKPAKRSAMWPPSTAQASTEEKPSPGVQKRTAGDTYSIPSATPQSQSRLSPSAKPPSTQNTAEPHSQTRIRIALWRTRVRSGGVASSQNSVRPICIAA